MTGIPCKMRLMTSKVAIALHIHVWASGLLGSWSTRPRIVGPIGRVFKLGSELQKEGRKIH